jgi:hypothetical protein
MGKELIYASGKPKEVLLKHLERSFGYKEAPPPANELTCDRRGNQVTLRFKLGVITWPGRGRFTGRITDAEKGCRLVGSYNSMLTAPLVPSIPMLPAFLLFREQLQVELLVSWGALTLFGLVLAISDRRKLVKTLEGVLG